VTVAGAGTAVACTIYAKTKAAISLQILQALMASHSLQLYTMQACDLAIAVHHAVAHQAD
jgi:hypothetical protein